MVKRFREMIQWGDFSSEATESKTMENHHYSMQTESKINPEDPLDKGVCRPRRAETLPYPQTCSRERECW